MAGDIALRFEAFGISQCQLDTSDVFEISSISDNLLKEIRTRGGPLALIIQTVRFGPHSKGDDTRDPHEIARLRVARDPLKVVRSRLDPEEASRIEKAAKQEVLEAYQQAMSDPAAEMLN
jgi:TPP-dependent pyruvate/acetoin dehydrogenase alpha subunit